MIKTSCVKVDCGLNDLNLSSKELRNVLCGNFWGWSHRIVITEENFKIAIKIVLRKIHTELTKLDGYAL